MLATRCTLIIQKLMSLRSVFLNQVFDNSCLCHSILFGIPQYSWAVSLISSFTLILYLCIFVLFSGIFLQLIFQIFTESLCFLFPRVLYFFHPVNASFLCRASCFCFNNKILPLISKDIENTCFYRFLQFIGFISPNFLFSSKLFFCCHFCLCYERLFSNVWSSSFHI